MLGIDPDPAELWPVAEVSQQGTSDPSRGAAGAVLSHCRALIDATAEACVAVKLQLARFEQLGAHGWAALGEAAAHARARGLLVIADGKRGDIDVSAAAYANALFAGTPSPFGHIAGLGADLATVNPLMGRDSIEPFLRAARVAGAGVLLLVRTSNAGAADLQDLELAGHPGGKRTPPGGPLWERVAGLVAELGAEGVGAAGISDVGAVVGATEPRHLARARELMPNAVFLLPGVGAQGGRVQDLAPAFAAGPAAGLVTASRSIARAHREHGGSPQEAARVEAERLREAAWALSRETAAH